ncbi:MAG: hypothetical protein ACYS6K_25455 [Planctomycetota bacterium]|jgi:hypothetical protein
MATTTFSGPVQAGTVKDNASANVGGVVLTQTATFAYTDTGAFATTIILPAGAQIIDQIVDITTAWNSVTSDALEIGTLADPDAFGDVADLQTAGRTVVDPDATQCGDIDDIGTSDVTVYLKITSAGGSLSAGAARVTITYRQN